MEKSPSFIKSKNSLNSVKAKAITFAGLSLASLGLVACGPDKEMPQMPEVNNTGIVTSSFKPRINWNESSFDPKTCNYNEGDKITTASKIEFLSAPATKENMYDTWIIETTNENDGCVAYPTFSELKDSVQFEEPKK